MFYWVLILPSNMKYSDNRWISAITPNSSFTFHQIFLCSAFIYDCIIALILGLVLDQLNGFKYSAVGSVKCRYWFIVLSFEKVFTSSSRLTCNCIITYVSLIGDGFLKLVLSVVFYCPINPFDKSKERREIYTVVYKNILIMWEIYKNAVLQIHVCRYVWSRVY